MRYCLRHRAASIALCFLLLLQMAYPLAVRVGASEWQAAFTSEYPEEQQPDWDAANEEAELLYGIGTENWQGETNGPENTTYPTLSDDDTNHPPVFDDGVILLYSFAQLQLVGSNQPLTQTDYDPTQLCSGTVVEDESGESVAYGADAEKEAKRIGFLEIGGKRICPVCAEKLSLKRVPKKTHAASSRK